jgi:hypothetical protein
MKIGDKVVVLEDWDGAATKGLQGVIRHFSHGEIGVDFGRKIKNIGSDFLHGHNLNSKLLTETGWYFHPNVLKLDETQTVKEILMKYNNEDQRNEHEM